MHLVSSYTLPMLPLFTPFFWSSFELLSIHTSIVPLSLFHSLRFHFLFLRPQTRKNKKRERFLKPPALDEKVHFKWSWRNRIFNPRTWWRAAIFTRYHAFSFFALRRPRKLRRSHGGKSRPGGRPTPTLSCLQQSLYSRVLCPRPVRNHPPRLYRVFFSTVSTPSVCLKGQIAAYTHRVPRLVRPSGTLLDLLDLLTLSFLVSLSLTLLVPFDSPSSLHVISLSRPTTPLPYPLCRALLTASLRSRFPSLSLSLPS